jgi:organic radical activating enzyme
VQAMDELNNDINIANKKLAVEIAINNGYRLSYQIHKELRIE